MGLIKKLYFGLVFLCFWVTTNVLALNCGTVPEYMDGTSYQNGDLVQVQQHVYRCDVAGWCTIGDAYAPGSGWAWENAWTLLGGCTNEPVITHFQMPTNAVAGEPVRIQANMADPNGFVKSTRLSIGNTVVLDQQSLGGFTELDEVWVAEYGTHSVQLLIKDDSDETAIETTQIVVADHNQPQLVMDMADLFLVGEAVELLANASGFQQGISSWQLTIQQYGNANSQPVVIASGGSVSSPFVLSGVAPLSAVAPGHYVAVATVVDNAGVVYRHHQRFGVEDPARPVELALNAPVWVPSGNYAAELSVSAANVPTFADVSVRMNTQEMENFADVVNGGSSSSGGNGNFAFAKAYNWYPTIEFDGKREIVATLNNKLTRTAIIREGHMSSSGGSSGGSLGGGSSSGASSGGSSSGISSSGGSSSSGSSGGPLAAFNTAVGGVVSNPPGDEVVLELNHDLPIVHGKAVALSATVYSASLIEGLAFELMIDGQPASFSHSYTTGSPGDYATTAFYYWQADTPGLHSVNAAVSGAGLVPLTQTKQIDVLTRRPDAPVMVNVETLNVVQVGDTVKLFASAIDLDSSITEWKLELVQMPVYSFGKPHVQTVLASGTKTAGIDGGLRDLFPGDWKVDTYLGGSYYFNVRAWVKTSDGVEVVAFNNAGIIYHTRRDVASSIHRGFQHPPTVEYGSGPVRVVFRVSRYPNHRNDSVVTIGGNVLTPINRQPDVLSRGVYALYDWMPPAPGVYELVGTLPATPDHAWSERMVMAGFPKELSVRRTIEVTAPPCYGLALWDPAAVYTAGDEVKHSERQYRAKWWTLNENPTTNSGSWQVWEDLGPCS